MPTYNRTCAVSWYVVAHPDVGDVETFEIFPWSSRAGSWLSHNDARRTACKNAKKCLQAAWKAADKAGGTPAPCEDTSYRRPQPRAATLRGAITSEVLDTLNMNPQATANGVTIEVFGRVKGDNGCGGSGLKTSTTFKLGKYRVKDISKPDSFTKID